MDLCVKNAKLVMGDSITEGALYIDGGKVAAVTTAAAPLLPADEVVDAGGNYVIPGVVDPHVHGGWGEPDRENYTCAGKAAAAGGVTTLMEQPLSYPPTATTEAFLDKKAAGEEQFVVDFSLWGGLIPGHLDNMKEIYKLGGGAFKSFMCRCSNYPSTNDGQLVEGMRKLAEFGGLSAVHAENDTLIQELVDKFNAEGKTDAKAYLDSHPPYSELEAIQRYILIAEQAPGSKAHVVHCSIPEGIDAITAAKLRGIDITVETCPQYLALCHDDLYERGGVAKCDPPVRSREDVEKLWEHVLAGRVDMITSDHSPHPFAKKVVPREDFPRAAEGVTSLQTMLPVILTEGVHKRGMSLSLLVKLMCENTAKRFGIWGRKGDLEPGFDGDFVILDLDAEYVCKAEDMFYLNKHTPYDGKTMKGKVLSTWAVSYTHLVAQHGAPVFKFSVCHGLCDTGRGDPAVFSYL